MELVARWWNGERDPSARCDIWLSRDGQRWLVRARKGGTGDPEVREDFTREYQARALVDQLIAYAPGRWKDITALVPRRDVPAREPVDD